MTPQSVWAQYRGKALAEIHRGCGYLQQPHPCDLEPPWDPFDHRMVTVWDCVFNEWDGPWDGSWFGTDRQLVHPLGEPFVLEPRSQDLDPETSIEQLVPIRVEQFAEDEATIAKAEQLLLALPYLTGPVSFEVLGLGRQPLFPDLPDGPDILHARRDESADGWTEPMVRVQFVARKSDAGQLQRQLLAHYPNSAIVIGERLTYATDMLPGFDMTLFDEGYGGTLCLETAHIVPLRCYTRFDPDPLGVAIAAMEQLGNCEWALLQILFQRAEHDWAQNAKEAVVDPYHPRDFIFNDISDRMLRDKFSSPLFAVSIRLLARRQGVWRHLMGWAEQFASPPQGLHSQGEENCGDLGWSAAARCTFRPGLLLNTQELASLIHLPGPTVASERLRRVPTRTRPAVATKAKDGIVLGTNMHRGQRLIARIPQRLRARHCYLAGASGTGKSTLLLNAIVQDVEAGHGVGVLDPHGDLINAVLRRIPPHRVEDVILFDPSDVDYPFALNILDAKDEHEQQRIVSETVMALERYFPSSWGPRLERILTYTIHTVLDAIPGATLADVEQMLIDPSFRADVTARITDDRWRQFWQHQFDKFPKNATDPVLNKLSVFLTDRSVRNIICQRRSTVDFDHVINGGKIFLANLSTGLLTERIAGTFGSFLVTKIVNAAFRRARLPQERRRPFYLYVDEFQAFMNLSVGFDRILAEARKYNLVLAGLANQYVGQLSPAVRQAIFGNVATMIVFRLGVDDANVVAKEMGVFTADEIMNLELGECIVRVGGSKTAHNVATYPEPDALPSDPTQMIIDMSRQRYARPRKWVERELTEASASKPSPSPHATEKKQRRDSSRKRRPPRDPSEDDLVS